MQAKDWDVFFSNIDVSLGIFTRFGFDSVSVRLIRKTSIDTVFHSKFRQLWWIQWAKTDLRCFIHVLWLLEFSL